MTDFLDMSDEEFAKLSSPPKADASSDAVETPVATPEAPAEAQDEPAVEAPVAEQPEPDSEGESDSPAAADADDAEPVEDGSQDPEAAGSPDGSTDPKPEPDPKKETEASPDPVDYKAFYERVIGKPIRANGKDIVLKTPEEVERLIQMGAGFGRKLQDLQPALKTLKMLEKNNLLDENEISYLIDIRNKNPDAIKKLIKDSGIDPLDLNTEDNVTYVPQNHSVSDEQMRFEEALSEVQSRETGTETLRVINESWDDTSKKALWASPELLGVIQSQRENGIYAQIVTEIDRQKLLGQIPHHTPFLQAYQLAGNTLFPPQAQAQQTQTTPVTQQQAPIPGQGQSQPKVIATRQDAPKAQVTNSDKARAASPTQTSSRKATTFVNPLEMADEDFLKTFKGRL